LHNGLVQDPTHGVIRAKLNNLIVVITSNQTREHSKALLDRTYWTTFDYLDPHLERRIISERTHAPLGLVRLIVDMARILRNAPYTSKPSLRGMIALAELVPTTTSTSEVDSLVKGLLCDPALVSSDMAELSKKLLDTSRKPLNWAAALRGARR
jgi:MoxR-like ATPase